MDLFVGYSKCQCGAITVFTEHDYYSCHQKNLRSFFSGIDLRRIHRYQKSYCCDYCVNHYGLELCGCGSGELFGECCNNLPECSRPMQTLDSGKIIARVHYINM